MTLHRAEASDGGVWMVTTSDDQNLLSYQVPFDSRISGWKDGSMYSEPLPAGRYTEMQCGQANDVIWVEDEHSLAWRVRADDIARFALDKQALTAKQLASLAAYKRERAAEWSVRVLDELDHWYTHIDNLPCDSEVAGEIDTLILRLKTLLRLVR